MYKHKKGRASAWTCTLNRRRLHWKLPYAPKPASMAKLVTQEDLKVNSVKTGGPKTEYAYLSVPLAQIYNNVLVPILVEQAVDRSSRLALYKSAPP